MSYHKFAETTLQEMFAKQDLENAEQYSAYMFQTSIIENKGNGKFEVRALPAAAQLSTVNAVLAEDFDGDNHIDLLLAGNFYRNNIQMGRYDASYGLLLKNDGRGNFKPVPSVKSGFSVKGETRKLEKIIAGDKTYYLAIRNNDLIKAFTLTK